MLDIKNLERRWLKYKLKSFLPYLIVVFVSLGSLVAITFWLTTEKNETQKLIQNDNNLSSTKTSLIPHSRPNNDNNSTVLEPSMEFVQSFQNIPVPDEKIEVPVKVIKKPIQTVTTPPKTLNMPEYIPQPVPLSVTPAKSVRNDAKSLSIDRTESKVDIEELERRFKETSNVNLGLFITRYYYEHGDYNKAYDYALKTNNINSRIDESWILFSKSLVKLGKTDQAKKTLQLYISQSNSETARNLLDAIERDNFK